MVNRGAITLALIVPMLAAAWLVLGPPEIAHASAFFGSGIPTLAAGEAVMILLAWLTVLIAACVTLMPLFRGIARLPRGRHSTALAALLLVIGLMLLTVSAVQRALPSGLVCCGSGSTDLREAIQLAR